LDWSEAHGDRAPLAGCQVVAGVAGDGERARAGQRHPQPAGALTAGIGKRERLRGRPTSGDLPVVVGAGLNVSTGGRGLAAAAPAADPSAVTTAPATTTTRLNALRITNLPSRPSRENPRDHPTVDGMLTPARYTVKNAPRGQDSGPSPSATGLPSSSDHQGDVSRADRRPGARYGRTLLWSEGRR